MLEAGFGLGEFSARSTSLGTVAEVEAIGLGVSGIVAVPLGDRLSVFGRAGAFRWGVERRATANGASISEDDTGIDFTYGGGVSFAFTGRLAIRLEWERFENVGAEDATGAADVDLISAGLELRML